jgi:hypothetical protein
MQSVEVAVVLPFTKYCGQIDVTFVRKLAFLPSASVYCGATPNQLRPFLGNAVSSIIGQVFNP